MMSVQLAINNMCSMKKFLYFLLLPLLCSCTDAILEEENVSTDKLVEVSFDLGGDYDIEFEDITRAGVQSGDLVAIQVFEGTTPYAYGLFNNAPEATLLMKAGETYKFECRVVKNGVNALTYKHKSSSTYGYSYGYGGPFLLGAKKGYASYYSSISSSFVYSIGGNYFCYLWEDYYQLDGSSANITRPANIVTYVGTLTDYRPMENGVVKLSLKCNKAPMVNLNFTSDVPDGQVTGTMTYYGYTTQTWSLSKADEIQFQRNTAPMAQIIDGTWWGGMEQLDFSMTWQRGPEANTFVTQHKNVTLNKTIYLDNDKNYTVNLHFRGQSDSDPEVWVGVDVDPDHPGDLDEEDDSNE